MSGMDARSGDIRYELVPEQGHDKRSEAPLVLLRRVLRGRYRLVMTCSLILAVLGAIAGYLVKPPRYESSGLVLIESNHTPLIHTWRENRDPSVFEAFITAQQARLRSRQVLDSALARPEMQAAGWPADEDGLAQLQGTISVKRGRRESTLTVTASHQEPAKAHAAVNAVLASFEEHLFDPTEKSSTAKERTLVEREKSLVVEIQAIRDRIMILTNGYGREAVDQMHAEKVRELIAIEEELGALAGDELLDGHDSGGQRSGLPAFQANIATHVAELERKELELIAKLEGHATRYGPNHLVIQTLKEQIESVGIQIRICERALADGTIVGREPAPDGGDLSAASQGRRERLVADLTSRRDELRRKVDALAPKRTQIAEQSEQARELSTRLWDTRRRLDELQLEAEREDVNRISVASWGDLPVTPATDRRRALAAAGALFGSVAGLALVVLIGLVDPRVRYLEELERMNAGTVLALLPNLDDGDGAAADRAKSVVDRLCGQLEVRERDPDRIVHCVTSVERGEGRTSVALAMARSFAQAGRRTIVIDADADRAGLTRALDLASAPPPSGDATADDLDRRVHPTDQEGLYAVPFGGPRGIGAADLSRRRLAEILEALRDGFDAIVIDAGPILESAEACVVAAEADNVVMVVGRNRHQQRVRASLERLTRAEIDIAGLVFNRAHPSDPGCREVEASTAPARLAPFASGDSGAAAPEPISISQYQPDDSEEPGESESWKRAA